MFSGEEKNARLLVFGFLFATGFMVWVSARWVANKPYSQLFATFATNLGRVAF
jgi:hypothetical protein